MGDFLQSRTLNRVIRAMDVSVKQHRLISSNITNRDTPGYKARHLDFEETMKGVLVRGHAMEMTRTDPRHISPTGTGAVVRASLKEQGGRVDGNTVDLSEEMARLVENNYRYQALARYVGGKFKSLKVAIQGG